MYRNARPSDCVTALTLKSHRLFSEMALLVLVVLRKAQTDTVNRVFKKLTILNHLQTM